ncbi:MAG: hypothetical protein A3D92_16645 [Bacteroidetes bacterium RIFCSPHIGHO2_02_FULL_44_7]|nr:MAG: hypothetical protein A3D92_16645 [Bacteroidetes bacterium RIFCSPHIGHO2_02_FULL_44_7]
MLSRSFKHMVWKEMRTAFSIGGSQHMEFAAKEFFKPLQDVESALHYFDTGSWWKMTAQRFHCRVAREDDAHFATSSKLYARWLVKNRLEELLR